jgi:hypothetical protein
VWEKLGKEKRDLLVDHVEKARDQQKETSEEFKDALQKLQEAYGRSGSELEKAYDTIKGRYERSSRSAQELKDRIARVEQTAGDLFEEWEKEIETLSSADFKRRSRDQLTRTKARYATLSKSMREAEQRVEPVLTKLRDYTTFLKHNLNAQALGTLKKEKDAIEKDTARLIKEMNESITEADKFIQGMKEQGES